MGGASGRIEAAHPSGRLGWERRAALARLWCAGYVLMLSKILTQVELTKKVSFEINDLIFWHVFCFIAITKIIRPVYVL